MYIMYHYMLEVFNLLFDFDSIVIVKHCHASQKRRRTLTPCWGCKRLLGLLNLD